MSSKNSFVDGGQRRNFNMPCGFRITGSVREANYRALLHSRTCKLGKGCDEVRKDDICQEYLGEENGWDGLDNLKKIDQLVVRTAGGVERGNVERNRARKRRAKVAKERAKVASSTPVATPAPNCLPCGPQREHRDYSRHASSTSDPIGEVADMFQTFNVDAQSNTRLDDIKSALTAHLHGRVDRTAITRATDQDGAEIGSMAFSISAGYALIEEAKMSGLKTEFHTFYKGVNFPVHYYPDKDMLDKLFADCDAVTGDETTPHLFSIVDSIKDGYIRYQFQYGSSKADFKTNWKAFTGMDAEETKVSWYLAIIGLIKRGALVNDELKFS